MRELTEIVAADDMPGVMEQFFANARLAAEAGDLQLVLLRELAAALKHNGVAEIRILALHASIDQLEASVRETRRAASREG